MNRFFLTIYRFFKKQRALMWVLLLSSFAVFAFFAARLTYVEDLTQLLPQTEKAEQSGLAFGQLSVKDKIFVEILPTSDEIGVETLAEASDIFVEKLQEKDSSRHCINNILYRIEDEWAVNGLDYALAHFPSLIEEEFYPGFEERLTKEAISEQMALNAETIANDWEGNATMLVSYDPAGLRYAMQEEGMSLAGGIGGYGICEKHFFTRDNSAALAFIAPDFKSFDSASGDALVSMIRESADELEAENPDVRVLFHGATVLSGGNSNRIQKDMVWTIGLSLLVILIVLMICFKNWSTIPHLLVPVLYGMVLSMACIYWMKGSMSLMALGLGSIVLGIAMSYVLHVLTHYKYIGDPEQVIIDQATPVCLGCITTIGAFAGLLFTESELLRDFGIFASIGLVGATLFALIFLPHFFNPAKNTRNEAAFAFLQKVNGYKLDRNIWLSGLIVLVSIVCLFTSRKVGFDSNMKNIGYVAPEVAESQDFYAEKVNNGLMSVYFASSATSLDEALDYNKAIVEVIDSLQTAGLVQQHSGVSALFKSQADQQANIDCWKAFWTPERIAQARKNITSAAKANGLDPEMFDPFFTMVEMDYEADDLFESGVLPVELSSNFVEKVGDDYLVFTSTLLNPEDKKVVCDAVCAKPHALVVDPFYYMSDMIEIVHGDFSVVLLISSIFVLIVLLISLRSVLLALLAFLPMFLSWYIVQGIMAIFGMEFNLINIIVSSFIFGVGVDYSIFIMDGLLSAARGGSEDLLAYHKTAITFSAFILVVVVCSLLFAKHPALSSVGFCTLVGMVSTIMISYCLQPFLFRLMQKVPFMNKIITRKK